MRRAACAPAYPPIDDATAITSAYGQWTLPVTTKTTTDVPLITAPNSDLTRVHPMNVVQAHHRQRGQHQDADARAKIAAINRRPVTGKAIAPASMRPDGGPPCFSPTPDQPRDLRLQRKQQRRGQDQPGHRRLEQLAGQRHDQERPEDSADQAGQQEPPGPIPLVANFAPIADQGRQRSRAPSATVLVPLASTAAGPVEPSAANKAGNVNSVPPPAIALTAPAKHRGQTQNPSVVRHRDRARPEGAKAAEYSRRATGV